MVTMQDSALIEKYFPHLTEVQKSQFAQLGPLYKDWNEKINLISRKDIEELYTRHVLHSLGIAKVMKFKAGSRVLDVGTGGGFPGIPLAILFPETEFLLVDSIGKKINVVKDVAETLGLKNVRASHIRAEAVKEKFDFVVSRAVTQMPIFATWVRNKFEKKQINALPNGILYLKGGDLRQELRPFKDALTYNLEDYFEDEFFETKKVVYVPAGSF